MKKVINLTENPIHIVSDSGTIVATYPVEYEEVCVIERHQSFNSEVGGVTIPIIKLEHELRLTPQPKLSHKSEFGHTYTTYSSSPSVYGWPKEEPDTIYIVSPHIWGYVPKGRKDFFVPEAPVFKSKPTSLRYNEGKVREFSSTFNTIIISREKPSCFEEGVEIIGYRMLVQRLGVDEGR